MSENDRQELVGEALKRAATVWTEALEVLARAQCVAD